jgi:hypothetical protein
MDLVFSDVWGPAPTSVGRNNYYVSFIDDYSKSTWVYFLHHKSKVFERFCDFQNLVERQFDRKILAIQIDWGGEYQSLNSFFQCVGIAHHVSCPHAHQHNGLAERKHRHIVEVGLSLLVFLPKLLMVIPPMNDCIRNSLSTPSFAPLDAPVGRTYASITQESFNFIPNGVYFLVTVIYTKRSSVLILLRGVHTSQEMLSLVNKCILSVFFIPMLVQGFMPRFPSFLIYYSTLVLVLGILFHLIDVFISLTQLMEILVMEILCLEQEKSGAILC